MTSKAVFLDRDGVINAPVIVDNKPYPPASLSDLIILEGVKQGVALLKSAGFKVFVVTNQPDVARGKTPQINVDEIHNYLMLNLLLDEISCCFHDDKEKCNCRKPKPGMLLNLAQKWDIDLSKSYLVGDRWRDIAAGQAAGVTTLLIDYGYDEKKIEADFTCTNFQSVVSNILNHSKQNNHEQN